MGNGYRVPPQDAPDELGRILRRHRDRVSEVERPSGTQVFEALSKVKELISNIGSYVTAYLASGFTTGSMTASGSITAGSNVTAGGNVTATGTGTFTAGVTSQGAANTNITLLPGTRSDLWVTDSGGVFGQTVSSIVYKTNLGELPFTAADILEVMPYVFQYKGQIAIRDDPENEYYDPNYEVPWEIGMMAEHLIEHGLDLFVLFDTEGAPRNIRYDLFGAVAALVIGHAQAERLAALERRIAALEG